MKRSDLIFIFSSFFIWRIAIFIFAVVAIRFVPLFSHNYFGGGYSNYVLNPLFWGHLNFDGEHYLAIAQNGYKPLEYFFFPLFPYLINALTFIKSQEMYAITGLIVSNLSFFVALVGIFKLVKQDYKENIAKLTVILFLIFPTSFYFGMYYTESIFLALIVWSFYFVRRNNFILASIIAAFASATRVIGALMFFAIAFELFLKRRKDFWTVLIAPFGVLIYIYYLWKQAGDPLIFLHQVSIFGEQRSSTLILLPQVLYRYVFKILPFVNYSYFPNIFTTYLEFIVGVGLLIIIIYGLFKLRISYSIYAIFAYLIPALAGSFSSMPRYALAIFPVFILMAIYIDKIPKFYKFILFSVMILLMFISTAMFWRGYWLS